MKLPGAPAQTPLELHIVEFDGASFDATAFEEFGMARASGMHRWVHKRQAEFFAGRWAARAALASLTGRYPDVPVGMAREPIWPAGVVGSITHVDSLAAAAVLPSAASHGVGIDIERVVTAGECDAVANMAIDRDEHRLLQSQASRLSEAERLTLAFSAKESLFKAAFESVRRHFYFEAVRLVAVDPHASTLTFELREHLGDLFPMGAICVARYQMFDIDTVLTWVIQ